MRRPMTRRTIAPVSLIVHIPELLPHLPGRLMTGTRKLTMNRYNRYTTIARKNISDKGIITKK
jgi:hypothetical protein